MIQNDLKLLKCYRREENRKTAGHNIIANEETLAMIGEERSLIQTTRMRQRMWIGHAKRRLAAIGTVIEG